MRNRLTKWKETIDKLENPKDRPNDFWQLVFSCMQNGLTVADAQRVFGLTERHIRDMRHKWGNKQTLQDKTYFMRRARALGADDETIAIWFGFDRVDKVSMILSDEV